ncbi:MAG TPA: metal-dependent hydrolase [Vicinamibacteria bacterium]|nr:metal-dependent hydrolase [Vicinamibacteria bacterium]
MDNLTHALVGAALAHVALPAGAPAPRRRLFMAAGVLAANLPDVDLLYVGITPPPLGYLLHHRGHTHTLVGLLGQGVLMAALGGLVPPLRRQLALAGARFWGLMAVALASHLALDAGNSYGVHPFHPFDSRWYYGDAVFILEPWLWVLVGVPLAWNAGGRVAGAALATLLTLLPVAMAVVGIVLPGALAALALAAAVLARWTRRLSAPAGAATALGLGTAFFAILFALSAVARAETRTLLEPTARGEIVDVVLNPNPADPLCWMAIAVEKDEAGGRYVLHRGTLSLVPAWRPPTSCASHRLGRGFSAAGAAPPAWDVPVAEALERLRSLGERDCRARAWLRFGRAPALGDGLIRDLRFDNGRGGNFTAMRLDPDHRDAPCPANVPSWAMPRADLLSRDPIPRSPARE